MKDKKHTCIGIIFTIGWISLIGGLTFFNNQSISDLTLNELGDFLAGSAAPLAVVWFFIGYLQQGEELKQNTEALMLQQKEMKIQSDQFAKQVSLVGEQLHLAKFQERPRLIYIRHALSRTRLSNKVHVEQFDIFVKNMGANAINFHLETLKDIEDHTVNFEHLDKDGEGRLMLRFSAQSDLPIPIKLSYQDLMGSRFEHVGQVENDIVKLRELIDNQVLIEKLNN